MKNFIFLYPIPEIIDFEIKNVAWHIEGGFEEYKKTYKQVLNECIDKRYRKNDFKINYALFNDCELSDVIDLCSSDKVIRVGLNFSEHIEKQTYPSQDFILNQFGDIEELVVTGFHLWSCVDKLAECAHNKGINTLVDENLTEVFPHTITEKGFRTDEIYFSDLSKYSNRMLESFKEKRKDKPWLWQGN